MSRTLDSYESAADVHVQRTRRDSTRAWQPFIDEFVAQVDAGLVLELGSGPGWHAAELERRDLRVERSDGAAAFVDMMERDGYSARTLDIITDDFGGMYDGIFANAVLLHLNSLQFDAVVAKAAAALRPGGMLAFTLEEGDGEEWSNEKLDLPRYFKYWREPDVRTRLDPSVWESVSIASEMSRGGQQWLMVLAERGRAVS
ncbi:methyltransferase domain-containing protein [Rhodococcus cerastii]|uniref:Methyltransferase domain-containing protein n=1 Tax=Rhodococcus cerastii TaxID=908616 RepID=A0ABU4D793_9NOCA|nr:methyltransferase domain-containing protein [Rhodococcus cerastii]MDV6305608.1 methyltransferase domain-containing protein [Rhodococcus cerastii]